RGAGGARDDAAALAELRALNPVARPAREPAAAAAGRPPRPRARAPPEHLAADPGLPVQPPPPAARAPGAARPDAPRAAARLRRRHALQPHLRPMGPAPVPG